MKSHVWYPISPGLYFMFCGRCGIINLKNKATQKVVNKPCIGRDYDKEIS